MPVAADFGAADRGIGLGWIAGRPRGYRENWQNSGMNPGIEDIRKRGSRILKDGARMLPAASLMMAEGLIRSAAPSATASPWGTSA